MRMRLRKSRYELETSKATESHGQPMIHCAMSYRGWMGDRGRGTGDDDGGGAVSSTVKSWVVAYPEVGARRL